MPVAAWGWAQVGAGFHPLAAQGEANALGNAEGADGIEFLRVKMLFKAGVFFFFFSHQLLRNCLEKVG